MKLCDLVLEKDDFITSDKLFYYSLSLNNPNVKYIKTDFIKNRKSDGLAYVYNWRNLNELIHCYRIPFIISGHSDYEINSDFLDILDKPILKFWLCQNKNIRHPKLFSVPIGITNSGEPNSRIHQIIGNTDRIYEISKQPKIIKNLAYLNIARDTYPLERGQVIDLYSNCSWVTYDNMQKTVDGHRNFLEQIYSHKFVFAPRGNGIDTHRLWESLYLRTIPIVKKCIGMEDFYDLPILFVDDWECITEDFLNSKYEEIMSKDYPLEKITIGYWYNFIDKCAADC